MKTKQLLISLTLGLGLTLALLWLLGGTKLPAAHAAPSQCPGQHLLLQAGGIITVCLSGGCDYTSIQVAVDAAASGEEIRVAAGTYTGVSVREGVTQVVYISKTITIQGGYTTTNWTMPYPITQPTTLDAQGQGRVLYITGDISPTVEGLHITGGDAAGLGGGPMGDDASGGVYVISGTTTLSSTWVFSNTARNGGGLYLDSSASTLSNNTVISNTAEFGGGLYLYGSAATLNDNTVTSNDAAYEGGGLFLVDSAATLISNTVTSNTAKDGGGGGLYLYGSAATLNRNNVISNTAAYAGGLYLEGSAAMLSGNNIISNSASGTAPWGCGGGLLLSYSDATLSANTIIYNTSSTEGGGLFLGRSDATLTNTVIANNQVGTEGSGLYIYGSSPCLLHTTIARNSGGDGSGVYVTDWLGDYSTIALTNTILVSHSVGITVTGGNTVTVNGVLWYGTPITISQAATATVTVQNQHEGGPAFAADGYHLTGASAGINQGVVAGVTTDIDGQSRDAIPDLGADEFVGITPIYLPLIMRQYQ